jgi:transcriptional regulator with XRE-family HTH domain
MKKQMPGVDSAAERAIFGQNFYNARLKLRLRQRDIHLMTGIAQSHISEIEKGNSNIAIDTMVKLARIVNLPLWRLFKPDAVEETDRDETDPRRAPRAKHWHEQKVQELVFNFTDLEMRKLRQAAAESGVTVMDYIRRVLDEHGWQKLQTPKPASKRKAKVAD